MAKHSNIRRTLRSLPILTKLRSLVIFMETFNSINIQVDRERTDLISVNRGVPRGSQLFPMVFNLCQNFSSKQITDSGIAAVHLLIKT